MRRLTQQGDGRSGKENARSRHGHEEPKCAYPESVTAANTLASAAKAQSVEEGGKGSNRNAWANCAGAQTGNVSNRNEAKELRATGGTQTGPAKKQTHGQKRAQPPRGKRKSAAGKSEEERKRRTKPRNTSKRASTTKGGNPWEAGGQDVGTDALLTETGAAIQGPKNRETKFEQPCNYKGISYGMQEGRDVDETVLRLPKLSFTTEPKTGNGEADTVKKLRLKTRLQRVKGE